MFNISQCAGVNRVDLINFIRSLVQESLIGD